MENQINIAELLKDCPRGMELDCTMYDNVTFERFDVEQNRCYFKAGPADTFWTTCHGKINGSPFGKCVIFPKGKTTWEGFVPPCQFKDGDIVATTNGLWIGITTGGKSGESIPTYCVTTGTDGFEAYFNYREKWKFQRLATEEEKQKLFDAIKSHGYNWNPDTKTLEKLPKFKVGDKIKHKDSGIYCTLGEYSEGISAYRTNIGLSLTYKDMEQWELVPNKFDIDTLVPFESRVLVRNGDRDNWRPAIFGGYAKNKDNEVEYYYALGGTCWRNCIPYEDNEHLRGTTDDCNEYFKTW